jgi:CBS domain-containing protein/ribosome-associated translation inhibitor RaiA
MGDILVGDLMESVAADEVASPGDPLGSLSTRMAREGVGEIFLVDGKRYAGMVTMRYLMRRRALPLHTKAESVVVNLPVLRVDESLAHAAEQLLATGERVLPVVRSSRLVGKLGRDILVRVIAETPRLSQGTVANIMTPAPETVRESDDVERARHIMLQLGEEAVPVADGGGKLVGVVTMEDLARRMERPDTRKGRQRGKQVPGRKDSAVYVGSLMRREAPAVRIGTPVREVVETIRRVGLRFAVVVGEERKVMGVVTDADLIELLVRDRPREECYVQITGVSGEDAWTLDSVYTVIGKRLKQMAKFADPRMVALHVVKYHPEGSRSKYSIRLRLTTARGVIHENTHGWDIATAVDDAMLTLEKRIKKQHEKWVDSRTQGPRKRP